MPQSNENMCMYQQYPNIGPAGKKKIEECTEATRRCLSPRNMDQKTMDHFLIHVPWDIGPWEAGCFSFLDSLAYFLFIQVMCMPANFWRRLAIKTCQVSLWLLLIMWIHFWYYFSVIDDSHVFIWIIYWWIMSSFLFEFIFSLCIWSFGSGTSYTYAYNPLFFYFIQITVRVILYHI